MEERAGLSIEVDGTGRPTSMEEVTNVVPQREGHVIVGGGSGEEIRREAVVQPRRLCSHFAPNWSHPEEQQCQ